MIFLSKLGISSGMVGFLTLCLMVVTLHAQPATSPAPGKVPGKTWAQMTLVEKGQFVCAMGACVAFFVAEVWCIVAGFKASAGWGLFMLFIGGTRSLCAAVYMIAWMIRWTMFTHQGEPFQLPMMIMTAFVVFAGSGAIVFFVRHWDKARKPLAVMGLGVLLILALVGLGLAT